MEKETTYEQLEKHEDKRDACKHGWDSESGIGGACASCTKEQKRMGMILAIESIVRERDEFKAELAHCEALLVDCQKAHDVTIAERDELWARLETVRKNCADENLPDDIVGGRTRAIIHTGEKNVRLPVRWFAEQMEAKLRDHDGRAGWEKCEDDWLLGRLREEIIELRNAIDPPFFYNAKHVIRECADVANFAMMIADNAKRGK